MRRESALEEVHGETTTGAGRTPPGVNSLRPASGRPCGRGESEEWMWGVGDTCSLLGGPGGCIQQQQESAGRGACFFMHVYEERAPVYIQQYMGRYNTAPDPGGPEAVPPLPYTVPPSYSSALHSL